MPIEKRMLSIVCDKNNQFAITTPMLSEDIIKQIKGFSQDGSRLEGDDAIWCKLMALNEHDEFVSVEIYREDIRGFMIAPFHASQPHGKPGIVQ